jgi:hypothetical protein
LWQRMKKTSFTSLRESPFENSPPSKSTRPQRECNATAA